MCVDHYLRYYNNNDNIINNNILTVSASNIPEYM